MNELDVDKAAEELLMRRRARESLLDFTKYTFPEFDLGPHHTFLCGILDQVEKGEVRRLIVTMPPRCSKSELISRRFPPYYLGRNPDHSVITATYGQDLSDELGSDVLEIVKSQRFKMVFDEVGLSKTSAASDFWKIENHRGRYIASSVGTSINGRGAHVFIIDDPFKDRDDADSLNRRERVWRWYRAVVRTRLMPRASIILLTTRWHDDDLVGRLLEDSTDDWMYINLASEAQENDPLGREVGEVLWPQWWDKEWLTEQRQAIGEREYASLYLGKPIRDQGDYFHAKWFEDNMYDELPSDGLRFYGASDYGTSRDGDPTVHAVFAVDEVGCIYWVDRWSERVKPDEWIETLLVLIQKYNPSAWAEERGQILKSVGPFLERRFKETHTYVRREQFSSHKGKEVRARSAQGMAQIGMIRLPKREEWVGPVLHNLTRFPSGKDDHDVDVLSLLCRMLGDMRGRAKREEKPRGIHRAGYTFKDYVHRSGSRRRGRRFQTESIVIGDHYAPTEERTNAEEGHSEPDQPMVVTGGGFEGEDQ